MAIAFLLGQDPSEARFAPKLLRLTLRTIFETESIQMFPTPGIEENVDRVKFAVPFEVPQLWHDRLEAGKAAAA